MGERLGMLAMKTTLLKASSLPPKKKPLLKTKNGCAVFHFCIGFIDTFS